MHVLVAQKPMGYCASKLILPSLVITCGQGLARWASGHPVDAHFLEGKKKFWHLDFDCLV